MTKADVYSFLVSCVVFYAACEYIAQGYQKSTCDVLIGYVLFFVAVNIDYNKE